MYVEGTETTNMIIAVMMSSGYGLKHGHICLEGTRPDRLAETIEVAKVSFGLQYCDIYVISTAAVRGGRILCYPRYSFQFPEPPSLGVVASQCLQWIR